MWKHGKQVMKANKPNAMQEQKNTKNLRENAKSRKNTSRGWSTHYTEVLITRRTQQSDSYLEYQTQNFKTLATHLSIP